MCAGRGGDVLIDRRCTYRWIIGLTIKRICHAGRALAAARERGRVQEKRAWHSRTVDWGGHGDVATYGDGDVLFTKGAVPPGLDVECVCAARGTYVCIDKCRRIKDGIGTAVDGVSHAGGGVRQTTGRSRLQNERRRNHGASSRCGNRDIGSPRNSGQQRDVGE